ncbi:ATP-binding cassette domain-containing protein [Cricetibacter osteomyelitidis]|uniref:peptide ABC transporter ATP-binding protein n=1 Tax=Cricetibacter osteomyelitidis TaxID=1521931 RepID=UPI0010454180|nr:ATP-binding cassette domain-containing protein [Cricetibacter osteomyelitidis]
MPLLQVEDLTKYFPSGIFGNRQFLAVQNVSFTLEAKKTLAIIGNNGSGKSTLVKMIAGLTEPTSGKIFLNGTALSFGDNHFRSKHIRMLFQDPNSAFNARLNVGQILDAPLRLLTDLDEDLRNEKIFRMLQMVGLYPDHANVKIGTMSVSQKQRVALARALIVEPKIVIADDSLNALDMSVRTQLTNLMMELQERFDLSYIYVGQHIGIIKHIADEVLVMNDGMMLEYGTTKEILSNPQNDITRRLVEGFFGHKLDESAWAVDYAKFM